MSHFTLRRPRYGLLRYTFINIIFVDSFQVLNCVQSSDLSSAVVIHYSIHDVRYVFPNVLHRNYYRCLRIQKNTKAIIALAATETILIKIFRLTHKRYESYYVSLKLKIFSEIVADGRKGGNKCVINCFPNGFECFWIDGIENDT